MTRRPALRCPAVLVQKDAARQIAFAEDGSIFEGYAAAGIEGIR